MLLAPRLSQYPDLRSNSRHLFLDVVWYGALAGSSLAFLSVYAAHLGANPLEIGLLTAVPAIMNMLFSLPSGHWLEGRPIVRATFLSSVWSRLGYLLLIPLPWLLGDRQQTWALIALIAVASVPGTVIAIAFNALFADIVPPDWRAFIVGRRNALLAVSLTASSLACGWLLDRISFPANYQVVFALGAVGAALSSYHLSRMRAPAGGPPPRVGRPIQDGAVPGMLRFVDAVRSAPGLRFLTRSSGRRLLRLDLLLGPFGPFLGAYLLFYACQYVPVALFPVFWLDRLGLSDGAISLGNALFYAAMLMSSLGLRRLAARLGHRRLLVLGSLLYGLYPFLTSQAHDAMLFWVASFVGGTVWGLLNGGLVNRLMERVPADDRPGHMALHNLALNLGILVGSFAGPAVAHAVGLREALIVAAVLRLCAGVALSRWA